MQDNYEPQTDYNLDDEYKPTPLLRKGNYYGHVINVVFNNERQSIDWTFCLDGNDGVMSDGETPIDGSHQYYSNWLPLPGDEDQPTKSGRGNKRQAKINMMKDFSDAMQINMSTPKAVKEALDAGEWIGIPVIVSIDLRQWEGRTNNNVTRVQRLEGDKVEVHMPSGEDDDIPF